MILITVVIPSFNCANWLRRAVLSTQRLRGCDVEVIVVDDGSTDETQSVLASLVSDTPSLQSLYQQNGGLSAARNSGLVRANGEYVLFLDADDELLDCDVSELVGTKCELIRFGVEEVAICGETIVRTETAGLMSGREYLSLCFKNGSFYTSSCAYLYQVEWLRSRLLCFEDGLLHEDNLFSIQALMCANRVFITPLVAYRYIRRADSITTAQGDEKLLERIGAYGYISCRLMEIANHDKSFDLRWKIEEVLDGAYRLARLCSGRRGILVVLFSLMRLVIGYRGYGKHALRFRQVDRFVRYARSLLFH